MCDFGISGYLVNSIAKTIDVGCKRKLYILNFNSLWTKLVIISFFIAYMAPERIDPTGKMRDADNFKIVF